MSKLPQSSAPKHCPRCGEPVESLTFEAAFAHRNEYSGEQIVLIGDERPPSDFSVVSTESAESRDRRRVEPCGHVLSKDEAEALTSG